MHSTRTRAIGPRSDGRYIAVVGEAARGFQEAERACDGCLVRALVLVAEQDPRLEPRPRAVPDAREGVPAGAGRVANPCGARASAWRIAGRSGNGFAVSWRSLSVALNALVAVIGTAGQRAGRPSGGLSREGGHIPIILAERPKGARERSSAARPRA
jgi:hypothetical protein